MTTRMMAMIIATFVATAGIAQDGAEPVNLLANPGFEQGLEGWDVAMLGDGMGRASVVDDAIEGRRAARIYATTDRSWSFLRQHGFNVAPGEGLVLTARVKASSSGAKIVLTGGFIWGDDPAGHQRVHDTHSGSGEWEVLRVSLTVEQLPVSAAIGFDYNHAGEVMLVDDVRLAREGDVLGAEALEVAADLRLEAQRDDLPAWVRAALRDRADLGITLAQRLSALSRYNVEYAPALARLREYVEARHQLVTWREDQPAAGAPLVLERIEVRAADGRAVMRLSMLNAFGERSVAVRVIPGTLTDSGGDVAVEAERVRLLEAIPVGNGTRLVDPGEDRAVIVPPGMPRTVQVVIPTRGLAAGDYAGTLLVQPLDRENAGPPQEIEVKVIVEP